MTERSPTVSEKRKIAYVMRSYPVLYHATVFNEIRALRGMGYTIEVFSLLEVNPDEARRDGIADLPDAIYCWTSRLSHSRVLKASAALLLRSGLSNYLSAFRFAREAGILGNLRAFARFAAWSHELVSRGVTHFHAHWATEAGSVAMLFSQLTGRPFSFTAHAYDIYHQPQALAEKLAAAEFAVTVSAYNKRYLAENYGEEHEPKIHVIYPLVDVEKFAPRVRPPENGALSILAIGRLTEYKGLIHLVEACRILKERGTVFVCRIAGEGEDRPMLESAIRRYGLEGQVVLLGSVPFETVAGLLEETTVFALPCVIAGNGDRDGMPIVLIEAMARGVPVVSSDVIGLRELVRADVGRLVPPADPAALADALQAVMAAGPEAQSEMGRAGRSIVEKELDARIGARKLAALFEAAQSRADARPSARKTGQVARGSTGAG